MRGPRLYNRWPSSIRAGTKSDRSWLPACKSTDRRTIRRMQSDQRSFRCRCNCPSIRRCRRRRYSGTRTARCNRLRSCWLVRNRCDHTTRRPCIPPCTCWPCHMQSSPRTSSRQRIAPCRCSRARKRRRSGSYRPVGNRCDTVDRRRTWVPHRPHRGRPRTYHLHRIRRCRRTDSMGHLRRSSDRSARRRRGHRCPPFGESRRSAQHRIYRSHRTTRRHRGSTHSPRPRACTRFEQLLRRTAAGPIRGSLYERPRGRCAEIATGRVLGLEDDGRSGCVDLIDPVGAPCECQRGNYCAGRTAAPEAQPTPKKTTNPPTFDVTTSGQPSQFKSPTPRACSSTLAAVGTESPG